MANRRKGGSEKGEIAMLRRFMIVGALFLGVPLLYVCGMIIWTVFVIFPSLCANEVFQEALSPDAKHRAFLFQRDCGATTWFSTQVSILDEPESLPNKPGNTFIVDDHPNQTGVVLRWSDSGELVIVTSSLTTAHKAETNVEGIVVRYETP